MIESRPGMPHSNSRIATFLSKQIDALQGIKNQREIAQEIGYEKPNIISMFKRGETKVPLDKIPALAKAIHVDPALLFKLALEQYWPELHKVVGEIFGGIQTQNEQKWWGMILEELGEEDPELYQETEREVRACLKKIRDERRPAKAH